MENQVPAQNYNESKVDNKLLYELRIQNEERDRLQGEIHELIGVKERDQV